MINWLRKLFSREYATNDCICGHGFNQHIERQMSDKSIFRSCSACENFRASAIDKAFRAGRPLNQHQVPRVCKEYQRLKD